MKWFEIIAKNKEFEIIYETAYSAPTVSSGIAELKIKMEGWKNFINDVSIVEVKTEEEYLGYFVRNSSSQEFKWEW